MRKLMASAGVAVALLAGCSATEGQPQGHNQAAVQTPVKGGSEQFGPPAPVPTSQEQAPATDGAMPAHLLDEFRTNTQDNMPLDQLALANYKEYATKKAGGVVLHFATLGNVQDAQRAPADKVAQAFGTYTKLANQQPTMEFDVYPSAVVEAQDMINPSQALKSSVNVAPRNKDMYMITVANDLRIGDMGGDPLHQVRGVTGSNGANAVSLLKTSYEDGTPDPSPAYVEACQAAVAATVINETSFPKSPVTELSGLAQEQVCNSVGIAVMANSLSISYGQYQGNMGTESKQFIGTMAQDGYAVEMPYFDETLYNSINTATPVPVQGHLLYAHQSA